MLRLPRDGRISEDLVTGQPVPVKDTSDGIEWRGTIPARDVRVLRLRPR